MQILTQNAEKKQLATHLHSKHSAILHNFSVEQMLRKRADRDEMGGGWDKEKMTRSFSAGENDRGDGKTSSRDTSWQQSLQMY